MNRKNKFQSFIEVELRQSPDGERHVNLSPKEMKKIQTEPLPHYYCLSTGRHSGSIYLKIGAAGR